LNEVCESVTLSFEKSAFMRWLPEKSVGKKRR